MGYPFYAQIYTWDCSLACIAMLASYYHGKKYNYAYLINKTSFYNDLNILQMKKFANDRGVLLVSYFAKWADFSIAKIKKPLICQVQHEQQTHFIVIYKKFWNKYLIADPRLKKPLWISKEKLAKIYTGIVLTSEQTLTKIQNKQKIQNLFYLRGIGETILLTTFISLLCSGATILTQFLVKIILDEFLVKKINDKVILWIIGFGLLFLTKILLSIILKKIQLKIETQHKKWWNTKFFSKIIDLPYIKRKKYQTGHLIEKYQKLNEVLSFYFPYLFYFLENILILLGSLTILCFINGISIVVCIPFISLLIFSEIISFPWKSKLENEKIQNGEKFVQTFIHSVENQIDRKRRNLKYLMESQLFHQYRKNEKTIIKYENFQLIKTSTQKLIHFSCQLLIIYFLINLNEEDSLSPGSFVFVYGLINNVIKRICSLFDYFVHYDWIKKLKTKIQEFFLETKIISQIQRKINFNSINSSLIKFEIEKLNFSYNEIDQLWKNNLNFRIQNSIIINGKNGSGKSTFLRLIAKELVPTRGVIKIENKKLNELESIEWNKKVYFLTSESVLFEGTVLENILNFQKIDRIKELWKKYQIEKWLNLVGLESNIIVKETDLSKGQKQLILFLSTFFVNCPIILLDEGLNSLVPDIRKKLLTFFLAQTKKEKLLIYATHNQDLISLFKANKTLISYET